MQGYKNSKTQIFDFRFFETQALSTKNGVGGISKGSKL